MLPIAGLLLRIGQPDLLDVAFISAAGGAIFDNLGILFAIGVAVGFARDGNGAAALAGVVCYFVTTNGAQTFMTPPPDIGVGLPEAAAALTQKQWAVGLIDRRAFDVVPPHVEYSLTPLGREAAERVAGLTGWIEANLPGLTGRRG